MTGVHRSGIRRVAAALALVCLVTQAIGTTVAAAAWARSDPAVVDARSSGHAESHHHPGCPWRGKGPCPHASHHRSDGAPAWSPCAEAPVTTSGDEAPRLLPVMPGDLGLPPEVVFEALDRAGPQASPQGHTEPGTPPPRPLPSS